MNWVVLINANILAAVLALVLGYAIARLTRRRAPVVHLPELKLKPPPQPKSTLQRFDSVFVTDDSSEG